MKEKDSVAGDEKRRANLSKTVAWKEKKITFDVHLRQPTILIAYMCCNGSWIVHNRWFSSRLLGAFVLLVIHICIYLSCYVTVLKGLAVCIVVIRGSNASMIFLLF